MDIIILKKIIQSQNSFFQKIQKEIKRESRGGRGRKEKTILKIEFHTELKAKELSNMQFISIYNSLRIFSTVHNRD